MLGAPFLVFSLVETKKNADVGGDFVFSPPVIVGAYVCSTVGARYYVIRKFLAKGDNMSSDGLLATSGATLEKNTRPVLRKKKKTKLLPVLHKVLLRCRMIVFGYSIY